MDINIQHYRQIALSTPTTRSKKRKKELFVATERNAKLRYEGYKKLSEM